MPGPEPVRACPSAERATARVRSPARVTRVLLVACTVLAVACTKSVSPGTTHRVRIHAFKFIPDTLAVAPGDTVVWVNEDPLPHTATAADGRWDTGSVAAGEIGRVVAESRGEQVYICAFHPNMSGLLIVR